MRTHANYDATDEILSQLGIKREDWTRFWNRHGMPGLSYAPGQLVVLYLALDTGG